MVRDLVIHIGDPKTGSTAIQTVLATGGWSAPGLTVLYPAAVNHLPLARCLCLPAEAGMRAARWRAVAARIAAAEADVAVISAELFERADPAALAATLAEFLPALAPRARVVGYVRPHADRLVAAWAERTKQGDTTADLAGFFDRAKDQFRYAPRLARWRAVFGDRLTIRPFIRDRLAGGDVVRDFLEIVTQGRPVTVTRPAAANESLCLEDLAVLRELHRRIAGRPALAAARRALGWNMAQELAAMPRPEGTKPRLHRALVPAVRAAYAADAAAMDAAFFDGTPTLVPALEAALARAVEAEQSMRAEDHFGPDTLRLIGVWADLATLMLGHAPDRIPAHFRARQQAIHAGLRGGGSPADAADGAGPDGDGPDTDGPDGDGPAAPVRPPKGLAKGRPKGSATGAAMKSGPGRPGRNAAGPDGAPLPKALLALLPPEFRRGGRGKGRPT